MLGGLLFAVIGGVLTYATWGSWWVLLGIVLLLIALIGVLGYAFDQR